MDNHPTILFHSEIPDFQLEEPGSILQWLTEVCANENKSLDTINYIFMTDGQLLKINQEYLNHDDYTDVISFQLAAEPIEGDIHISIDRVRDNALTLSIPFDKELRRVMVHGLLHFIGYQDKTETDQAEMTQKEDEYLAIY